MSGPGVDAAAVAERAAQIAEQINVIDASGRTTVIAVTKGFGIDAWRAAMQAGLCNLGESYAQELETKWEEWALVHQSTAPRMHFIGRLQRNKVRKIASLVSVWHSVDRASLGQEIQRHAPGSTVLAQVNISGEPNKGGCAIEQAPRLVDQLCATGLNVVGLMGVASAGSLDQARSQFHALAQQASGLGLVELSMGMSNDFAVAVEEGATLVRIGSSLFGPRPVR